MAPCPALQLHRTELAPGLGRLGQGMEGREAWEIVMHTYVSVCVHVPVRTRPPRRGSGASGSGQRSEPLEELVTGGEQL